MGAIAGILAGLTLFGVQKDPPNEMMLIVVGAGYSGADFIESFVKDYFESDS